MFYKVIDKYNIVLGRYFFNNLNLFTYNIFNFFLKKISFKKNIHYLDNFINNGIQKVLRIPDKYIDDLNKLLLLQEKKINSNLEKIVKEDAHFQFEITEEIQQKIFDIINGPLNEFINELRKYYCTNIVLSDAEIRRNYNINAHEEKFSNFFHSDGYTCTLVKVFINLHEVTKDHGPLRYVEKKDAKMILKKNKININRVPEIKEQSLIKHNTGQKGDVFLCNTSDLIHAAGIPSPGFFRDMLFLELCALPRKKYIRGIHWNNIKEREFPTKSFTKIISKPEGIKNLFKDFIKYL
jgi:hypothetical protein